MELGAAIKGDAVLKTVDAMFNAIERQQSAYERLFGVVPNFRVGIHGGDVVVSEQGDTKRSIGIYGDAINIAARMEDAAAAHGVRCILSNTVAEALANRDRIHEIGEEAVRGISATVRVCEYRPLTNLTAVSSIAGRSAIAGSLGLDGLIATRVARWRDNRCVPGVGCGSLDRRINVGRTNNAGCLVSCWCVPAEITPYRLRPAQCPLLM